MQLKKAKLSGTTSESGLGLQHEAAMRVEARFLAEEKKRRHARLVGMLKNFFAILFFLGVCGAGFYAWRSGMLDAIRSAPDSNGVASLPTHEAGSAEQQPAVKAGTAEVKKIENSIDAINEVAGRFAGVSVSYWKDAPAADKPMANCPSMTYTALVPDADGGQAFLELTLSRDNSVKASRYTKTRGKVDISRAEFGKMIESTPYLVMREGRAYYCSAGKPGKSKGFPVPGKGETFNPSRHEFLALYDQLQKMKIGNPPFKYEVFLDHVHFAKPLSVAIVGFGEEVARDKFEAAARAAVDDDAAVAAMLTGCKVGFRSVK